MYTRSASAAQAQASVPPPAGPLAAPSPGLPDGPPSDFAAAPPSDPPAGLPSGPPSNPLAGPSSSSAGPSSSFHTGLPTTDPPTGFSGVTPMPSNAWYNGFPGLTREQLDARFVLDQRKVEIELRKAEADLAAIEARTARENKESQARITAMQTSATTTSTLRIHTDEEEPIGEIPQAALLVASRFPGLPKAEIARIFSNKFRPENLYKLRHLKRRKDKDRDENITIENGQMRFKRVTGTLCDFGSTWDIWSESFVNYVMVMVDFFGLSFPSLCRVLLLFYTKIHKLSKVYDWQGAVLPLALDFHTEITTTNHTNIDAWILLQTWIDQYCSPHNILAVFSKKRPASTTLEGPISKKGTKEVCRNYNTKSCTFKECVQEHKCSECNSKDYNA